MRNLAVVAFSVVAMLLLGGCVGYIEDNGPYTSVHAVGVGIAPVTPVVIDFGVFEHRYYRHHAPPRFHHHHH